MIPKEKEKLLQQMWARQQICGNDVDYDLWHKKKELLQRLSQISHNCMFAVDVYKGEYCYASDNFTDIFGYSSSRIRSIENQGDMIEESVHPDDREQLLGLQLKHSHFIYSLPPEERNYYRNIYQYRMKASDKRYINVTSTQQVLLADSKGKAWIIMGALDISPDQSLIEIVKYSMLNLKTGELHSPHESCCFENILTAREIEILQLIGSGNLSKEIAGKLYISTHTVNNHRKSILAKLGADNSIEAINLARRSGLLG